MKESCRAVKFPEESRRGCQKESRVLSAKGRMNYGQNLPRNYARGTKQRPQLMHKT